MNDASNSWVASVVGGGVLVVLAGCPPPVPPTEACSSPDDPMLTLANRGQGREAFTAGGTMEVFDAPQGGVFAELDVTVTDMGISELDYLRVEVEDVDTRESLAVVRYFGNSVPLRCGEDEVMEMQNMPLGFVEMYRVEDLDGRVARLSGVLETVGGDFEETYEVVLRAVDY